MAIPALCRHIQTDIDGLKAEKAELSEDLKHASPTLKPGIARQIRAVLTQIRQKEKQLTQCIAAVSRPLKKTRAATSRAPAKSKKKAAASAAARKPKKKK